MVGSPVKVCEPQREVLADFGEERLRELAAGQHHQRRFFLVGSLLLVWELGLEQRTSETREEE